MTTELTGQRIISRLRTKHVWSAFGYGILSVSFFAGVCFCIWLISDGEYAMGAGAALICAVCLFFFVRQLVCAVKIAVAPQKTTVFRKYGTPDEIADRINRGLESIILEQRNTVVTEDYILYRKHYETFVPLADVMLMYRKEHRTNGVLDSIALVVHDRYGESYEYPFLMGKKYAADMEYAVGEISKRAPDCIIGYNQANIAYVKEHKEPIPE